MANVYTHTPGKMIATGGILRQGETSYFWICIGYGPKCKAGYNYYMLLYRDIHESALDIGITASISAHSPVE